MPVSPRSMRSIHPNTSFHWTSPRQWSRKNSFSLLLTKLARIRRRLRPVMQTMHTYSTNTWWDNWVWRRSWEKEGSCSNASDRARWNRTPSEEIQWRWVSLPIDQVQSNQIPKNWVYSRRQMTRNDFTCNTSKNSEPNQNQSQKPQSSSLGMC
jgi:hypothetical protein